MSKQPISFKLAFRSTGSSETAVRLTNWCFENSRMGVRKLPTDLPPNILDLILVPISVTICTWGAFGDRFEPRWYNGVRFHTVETTASLKVILFTLPSIIRYLRLPSIMLFLEHRFFMVIIVHFMWLSRLGLSELTLHRLHTLLLTTPL